MNSSVISSKQSLMLFFLGWLGLWVFALAFSQLLPVIIPYFLSAEDTIIFLESLQFFHFVNFFTYITLFLIGSVLLFPYIIRTLIPAIISSKWLLGFPFTFVILFSSYALMMLYERLGITIEDNQNQAAIVILVRDSPWISFLTFGFLGPIVEEWTYRLGLFNLLKRRNRWIAYLVTLTIFGFIHFDFTASNLLNELINLPIYLIAGAWFCFIYDHFGLQVAISTHIMNNVFSVLAIFLQSELSSSSSL